MTGLFRHSIVVSALLVAGAAPVCAQVQNALDAKKTREITTKYGECVVELNAPVARGVVLGDLHDLSVSPATMRLLEPRCVSGPNISSMTFPGDTVNYTLAEALVRKDYPAKGAWSFAALPALAHHKSELKPETHRKRKAPSREKPIDPAERQASIDAFYALAKWGECVVRRDPANVHAMLLAEPSSEGERTAIEALKEPFGVCLGEGEVALSRQNARGTLAVNFYRLAGAPAGARIKTPKVS